MKVLLVSTAERTGGGAIAARRLLTALLHEGIDATMVVRDKQTDLPQVVSLGHRYLGKWKFVWERFVIWCKNLFSRRNLFKVSIANTGFDISRMPAFRQADIIHLHWVNQGMLSLEDIRRILESGKPVIWTMHDMWQCTGICHYSYDCDHFHTECRECHFLRFPGKQDLANRVFRRKKLLFAKHVIHIATVSRWLEKQVQQSALLGHCPTCVIPNTLPLSEFEIMDKTSCRQRIGVPLDKYVILFGAARVDDPIKGFGKVLEAIDKLLEKHPELQGHLHLVTFGTYKNPKPVFPIPHTDMGWIKDNTMLSILYSAADVAVSASKYETFGQTLIEAQACGCIPVSFGNSGQADIIRHKQNGYIAEYMSAYSLANGIFWGLTEGKSIEKQQLRDEVVTKYSSKVVSAQYQALYKSLLNTYAHQ